MSIQKKFQDYQKALTKAIREELKREEFYEEIRRLNTTGSSILDLYHFLRVSSTRKKLASEISLDKLFSILSQNRRSPEELVIYCSNLIKDQTSKPKKTSKKISKKKPLRNQILTCLSQEPCEIGDLVERTNRSKSNVGSSLYHLIKSDIVKQTGTFYELKETN